MPICQQCFEEITEEQAAWDGFCSDSCRDQYDKELLGADSDDEDWRDKRKSKYDGDTEYP